MLFVSYISRRFIEDVSSWGWMPQMKTLIALFPCLKQLAILIRPFAISSGESWYKLLVPHNIITFLKDEIRRKSWTCHSTCYTLSPPIPQLKALSGLKNLFQTLSWRANPAIRESPISIVSKLLLFNLEQCLRWVFIQFVLDCRAVGIAVIITDVINVKRLL